MINRIINSDTSTSINFGALKIPRRTAVSIKNAILQEDTIYLHGHKSPDEDSINSVKLLYNFRKRHGKKSFICIDKDDIAGLFFKPDKYKVTNKSKGSMILSDCNAADRTSKLLNSEPNFIIDHHLQSNKSYNIPSYIDTSAKSCCAIIYRFFESLGEKLNKSDYKSLYCGILSDYEKSELIKFENTKLVKLPALFQDKNAQEVLDQVEKKLSESEKSRIYKHLDILSTLTKKETVFREKISSEVQFSSNGKLAYIIIDPKDKQWKALGMDNTRNSVILRDLRLRMLNNAKNDALFSETQKEKLKKIKGAIIFYRAKNDYQMSIHSKENYTRNLINYIKENINKNLEAGGHRDRGGGRIHSLEKNEVETFINSFLIATEKIN